MDARHASLGRRTLEEIRQKRAAERLHRASSGSDLESSDPYGTRRPEGGNQTAERDSYALVKELENKNTELERENRRLLSKLEEEEVENDSLMKRLNDLEKNTLPSLRKSLKDVFIEKDAAVVAREDALSQLRTMKKRLKEAEEEQYRAEEDAAALRAELNSLQQQGMGNSFSSIPLSDSTEKTLGMEKEIMDLKSELQHESLLRQQEQQKLAKEQLRTSSSCLKKQELEDRLAALTKKISEDASDLAAHKGFSVKEKEKLEKQLHDMAIMVERLENSRQKLLMEIDSQSSELERLFEENSNLSAAYQDALGVAGQWENQVKDCLKQNEELRCQLDMLRTEQINPLQARDHTAQSYMETERGTIPDPSESGAENLLLKDQLVKEKSRAEALAAEVMKLTAELRRAVQAHHNLTHLYRPVLRNIENNLMKMKQETFA
ncbi:plectin [Phoenix dactylifera]|uniref:Plectin n=1 Tax=Phoenix dactylifera TaxID=42345 RepID=A0A8B7C5J5_PHODC|nr:plectin [Phoenix dactylifera]